MDRLSSCYFCGAALDASLSEYSVVPRRLQSEDGPDRQVTLCPTCRRKLATVIKEVTAAAEVDPADQSGLMDESGMEPGPDPMAVGDASETGDDDDVGFFEDGDDGPVAPEEPTDDTLLGGEPADGEPATTASEPTAASEPAAGSEPAADERAAGTEAHADEQAASEPAADADDGPSLTRLEYSKVMRLLQNRQLPVERSEIRAVAVNAYDIEGEEFDAIIDAAVDRGLIAEANGKFVETE